VGRGITGGGAPLVALVQFELSAALECSALAPLWPKRRQVDALHGGAQFKLHHYPSGYFYSN